MQLPPFIEALPSLDLSFPDSVVTSHVVQSDVALAVFFVARETFSIPEHSHRGQWGIVIEGRLDLTIDGETVSHHAGGHYNIPPGAPHSAVVHAGSVIFDAFEDVDRYTIRSR